MFAFSSVQRWTFGVECSMFAFLFRSVRRWKFGVRRSMFDVRVFFQYAS